MPESVTLRRLTCIQCPRGCRLSLHFDPAGALTGITDNGCDLGPTWARREVEDPVRVLTSSVRVDGGSGELVSVRSARPLPRRLLAQALDEVRRVRVTAPVAAGQVVLANLAGSGIALTATRAVEPS